MNCLGHKCRLYSLMWRPPGKSYETLDDILFCPECVLKKCVCLGIHVSTGMSVSFLALADMTPKTPAVPMIPEKAVVAKKSFRLEP